MFFTLEERPSDSSFVQAIWSNQSERSESFISTAGTHWEMVLMRHKGQSTVTVRGPETKATPADFPADAEWLGITFKLGTFMPDFLPGSLVDRQDVMHEVPLDLSPRALQYRFQRATGLTRKAVQQIQRAWQATALLEQGCPILDTAYQLGYFDQSHLTNSLRRYMGQTPAQISQALQPEYLRFFPRLRPFIAVS